MCKEITFGCTENLLIKLKMYSEPKNCLPCVFFLFGMNSVCTHKNKKIEKAIVVVNYAI